MNNQTIRDRLVEHGKKLFDAPKEFRQFTGDQKADVLLNDLEGHPHAFVLACLMDRQTKHKPWLIPYKISEKLGGFSMKALQSLSQDDVTRLMTQPSPLHRHSNVMSKVFYSAVQRIASQYGGDASGIWSGKPSSAETMYRFLQFVGAGPKIASMATNILAREFKLPFADYYSIDISADVHVLRVFSRLGLCASDPTPEQVIYKAKALYPQFPGMMDYPCWEIGMTWCKSQAPECSICYMNDICPTAKTNK